jgi:hypothetical protein
MITLPNGVQVPDEDDFIAGAHAYRCVAHPSRWMVCLHEEPPKSLNPQWRAMPDTRFPVCNECHEMVHQISRQDAALYLIQNRMKNFPKAEAEVLRGLPY